MRKIALLAAVVVGLWAAAQAAAVVDPPAKQKKKPDPVQEEVAKLQGTWELVDFEYRGRRYGQEIKAKLGNPRLVIKGDRLTGVTNGKATTIALKIDITKNPKQIELTPQTLTGQGNVSAIYEFDGETLRTCLGRGGMKRPTGFNDGYVMIWKRAKR